MQYKLVNNKSHRVETMGVGIEAWFIILRVMSGVTVVRVCQVLVTKRKSFVPHSH